MAYYTTAGKTRHECGHYHLDIKSAAYCMARDQRACGGYSDRRVVRIHNLETRPLSLAEQIELDRVLLKSQMRILKRLQAQQE